MANDIKLISGTNTNVKPAQITLCGDGSNTGPSGSIVVDGNVQFTTLNGDLIRLDELYKRLLALESTYIEDKLLGKTK